ncbi:28S rRNA (cytosine-C(5))-methyltransferase-like isoform X2 [Artemia franciscana]|uniref:28S rRNA (cytosine-C(5))-methyltransferase-like isoform X2 n=1 Tax=Artemia franciscana TaxID=6661 RepID=UPI0032DB1EB6
MKVPELYITASNILKSHTEKRISLKSLIYNSNFQNIRQLYALLHEVIKSSGKIDHVLAAGIVHITEKEKYLARFFLYDIVLKGRRVASSHPLVKSIAKSRKELTEKLKECNERKISDLGKVPRYARVNTLKAEVREVIEILKSEGWILKDKIISYEGFLDVVRGLSEDEFIVDFHLEYLLVFHSNTDFHDHELVKTGVILLQDKASCLSAVALNPKRGSQVIDACAAPGMKTTLLAALMENEGRIVAVDRSKERSQCLSKFVESTGSSCVEIVAMDFLKIQPNEYPDIKYILVDPSCSGSGIARRLGNEYGQEESHDRLRKLLSKACHSLVPTN